LEKAKAVGRRGNDLTQIWHRHLCFTAEHFWSNVVAAM